jgi:hypothetical protein
MPEGAVYQLRQEVEPTWAIESILDTHGLPVWFEGTSSRAATCRKDSAEYPDVALFLPVIARALSAGWRGSRREWKRRKRSDDGRQCWFIIDRHRDTAEAAARRDSLRCAVGALSGRNSERGVRTAAAKSAQSQSKVGVSIFEPFRPFFVIALAAVTTPPGMKPGPASFSLAKTAAKQRTLAGTLSRLESTGFVLRLPSLCVLTWQLGLEGF